jgi:diguanylate cyclase (GGDEF)-like protein/PAS domain S-box-containing protein
MYDIIKRMSSPPDKKYTILIVEDDPDVLSFLSAVFKKEYNVLLYTNPLEALKKLETQKEPIAVMISDQMMPGLNGLEFFKKASFYSPLSARLLLTAQPKTEDLIQAINEVQVDRFITKPVDIEVLKNLVVEGIKIFENRQRQLNLNDVGDAVIILNQQKQIESLNAAAEKLFGYSSAEVQGKNFKFLFFESHAYRYEEYFDVFRTHGGKTLPIMRESTGLRKDGTTIPLDLSINKGQIGQEEVFIITARSAQKRKLTEERTKFQIYHDQLTGLPNRQLFSERICTAISQAAKRKENLAVLSIILDRFQILNNTLGHTLGDQILEKVASIFTLSTRDGDIVSRFGADEFAILLVGIHDPQEAGKFAQRLLDAMNRPIVVGNRELYLSCSIGISIYPTDGENAETLIAHANTAMIAAKQEHGNTYQFFNPDLNIATLDHFIFETGLRKALERGELLLYYQPIVDAYNLNIAGVEALIRWNHPDLGLVPPSDFIPIAEETGLIVPIGEWALETACKQNKMWQARGIGFFPVMVNVSSRQFRDQQFVETVQKILKKTELNPFYLELEVTESLMMQNVESVIKKLHDLKDLGVLLCIDDFGTGYSSFSYLKRFPIDVLKIDQSFVRDLGNSPKDAAVASAIIDVAHRLELEVVAEGVETKEQLAFLRAQDCDKLQGFLFTPPMPAEIFSNLKSLCWKHLLNNADEEKVM